MKTMKTVLITGCSSGYGLETARHFHARAGSGRHHANAARRRSAPFGTTPRPGAGHDEAERIAAALEACGPIDVLVNNAGIGLFGAFEATPMATVRDVFETNTFGGDGDDAGRVPGKDPQG